MPLIISGVIVTLSQTPRVEDFSSSKSLTLWAVRGETSDAIATHRGKGECRCFIYKIIEELDFRGKPIF